MKMENRTYEAKLWRGEPLDYDYMLFKASAIQGPFLDMVKEENGIVVKAKLYLSHSIIVSHTDNKSTIDGKTLTQIIEEEKDFLKKSEEEAERILNEQKAANNNIHPPCPACGHNPNESPVDINLM